MLESNRALRGPRSGESAGKPCDTKNDLGRRREGGGKPEVDLVKVHLNEIGKFPLLTPEEELHTGNAIVFWKTRLEKALFHSDFVSLRAVTLIRSILENRARLDSDFLIKRDGSDGRGGLKGLTLKLKASIATIERLLADIQDTVPLMYDASLPTKARFDAALQVYRDRRKIAKLLIETKPRRSLIKTLKEDLLCASQDPRSYWCTPGGEAMVQDLRIRNGKPHLATTGVSASIHVRLFGESDSHLTRRISNVQRCDDSLEEARTKMWQHNCRLVVRHAKKLSVRPQDLLDRIQDGNEGMGVAVDLYDPKRSFRFPTYATNWIKQRIGKESFEGALVIRRKMCSAGTLKKLLQAQRTFTEQHGRTGNDQELSEWSGIALPDVKSISNLTRPIHSLDTPVISDDRDRNTTLGSLIPAREEEELGSGLDREWVRQVIHPRSRILQARESFIIRLRFGILSDEEHANIRQKFGLDSRPGLTLEQIGSVLDISKERVRQIEVRAKGKLERVLRSAMD